MTEEEREQEKKDIELSKKVHRTLEFIYAEINEEGEISQFKEDVLYVINELLDRLPHSENLSVTQTVNRNYQNFIRMQREKRFRNIIETQRKEIARLHKILESEN